MITYLCCCHGTCAENRSWWVYAWGPRGLFQGFLGRGVDQRGTVKTVRGQHNHLQASVTQTAEPTEKYHFSISHPGVPTVPLVLIEKLRGQAGKKGSLSLQLTSCAEGTPTPTEEKNGNWV